MWVTLAIGRSRHTALQGWGEERLGREGVGKAGMDTSLEFSVFCRGSREMGRRRKGAWEQGRDFPPFLGKMLAKGKERERLMVQESSKGRAAGGGCLRSRLGWERRMGRGVPGRQRCQLGDWKMRAHLIDSVFPTEE